MTENLFSKNQKVPSDKYRENYDKIFRSVNVDTKCLRHFADGSRDWYLCRIDYMANKLKHK